MVLCILIKKRELNEDNGWDWIIFFELAWQKIAVSLHSVMDFFCEWLVCFLFLKY